MKTRLLLVILSLIFQLGFAQSQYSFEHYSKKDGLGNDMSISLAQDSMGYIWIQSFVSLTSFDGYNFKVYRYDAKDPLRSALNFILHDLSMDDATNIWIPEHHPGKKKILVKYDRKTDGFIKYEIDMGGIYVSSTAFENTDHSVWLGTEGKGLFRYNFSTGKSEGHQNGNAELHPERNAITGIKNLGSSLLLSTYQGLWVFDKNDKTFRRPPCRLADTTTLFAPEISIPFYNKDNSDTWLVAGNSFLKIDSNFSIVHKFDLPEGVRIGGEKLAVDSEGVIWFGGNYESKTGLYRYDPRDKSLINLKHDPANHHSLPSDIVYDVIVDSDQNVWVGTDHGISVLRKRSLTFINQSIHEGTLYGSALYKANGSEYLVINKVFTAAATNVNQIMMGRLIADRLDSIKLQPVLKPMEKGYVQLFYQGRHYFWISHWPFRIVGYPIDPITGMFHDSHPRELLSDQSNPNTIRSFFGAVAEDSKGNLLVAADTGIDIVSPSMNYGVTGSVRHIEATKSIAAFIYHRDKNSFWTFSMIGKSIGVFYEQSDSIDHIFELDEMPNTITSSSDGSLLIGTQNGIYQAVLQGGRYKFLSEPLIPNTEVNAIQEDRSGRLWVYADDRIICYDRSGKVTTVFGEEDGVEHCRTIYTDWLHQTREGIMIAADPNGLSIFDPSTFKFSQRKVIPVLTRLTINNTTTVGKTIHGDENFVLSKDISLLNELILDYRHNNFSVEFSAMEMTAAAKNLYQHKLDGYDPDWIPTDYKNRTATYTNLPAREYTLRVKASNHHGVWSDQERTLKVTILPPPWRSWWAYTGYGLLVAGLLVLARRTIVQRERLKSNLKVAMVEQEKEHFELEKAKEVDRVKTSFFTNISHEFRTPLTLIKGPVQNLLEKFEDNPEVRERLKMVQRNSDLLLKLINQLLDLARLEAGSLKVEKAEGDMNSFINAVTSSFSSLASQKNITLEIDLPSMRYQALFDKDKLETILINLINNAIKFTPADGKVSIKVTIDSDQLILSVADTGIGIAEDQQQRIFERFHQVSEAHKEVGTGIGLALVKELVALLGGNINVRSEPGNGSEFKVTLPIEFIRVLDDGETETLQLPEVAGAKTAVLNKVTQVEKENETDDANASAKPHVLVVEDNNDLRAFIIDSLGHEFYFLEAGDGKHGLEIATREVPDLIISDVMMPEMDGITMAGKIKNDIRTSHVPLILLTAKSTEDSKLTGLSSGADDYLTKPFNKNELLLKARNSIAIRSRMREKLRIELMSTAPKVEVLSADEQFLMNVKEGILNRLSDEQLSVESLSEDIGLSRVQLYRKVSALTGLSVNELIRSLRLQKAAQLLEQNWGPVSQVAYEVGFSNLSYFSKVFKEEYGVLPSEYSENGLKASS